MAVGTEAYERRGSMSLNYLALAAELARVPPTRRTSCGAAAALGSSISGVLKNPFRFRKLNRLKHLREKPMSRTSSTNTRSRTKEGELVNSGLQTEPIIVSCSGLAQILSDPPLTSRRIQQLADQGVVVRAAHGKYDLAKSLHGFIEFKRAEVEAAKHRSSARRAFESERTRKLKFENDSVEVNLIDTRMTMETIAALVGVYQTEMQTLPIRATNDPAYRQQWEEEINRISENMNNRLLKALAKLEAGRAPLDSAEAESS